VSCEQEATTFAAASEAWLWSVPVMGPRTFPDGTMGGKRSGVSPSPEISDFDHDPVRGL
jgi:hypothetical protein